VFSVSLSALTARLSSFSNPLRAPGVRRRRPPAPGRLAKDAAMTNIRWNNGDTIRLRWANVAVEVLAPMPPFDPPPD